MNKNDNLRIALSNALDCLEKGLKEGELSPEDENDALNVVSAVSSRGGLSRTELERLSRLIGSKQLKIDRVLRHMIPQDSVGKETIVQLVGSFSWLSLKDRVLLLKWLILVSRKLSMEATQSLHELYPVLFHFLDYEATRPLLCRLLYMLTRRKDVNKTRVDRLTALIRNLIESGQDPSPLLLLYDLFAHYAPQVVNLFPQTFARPKSGFFKVPDEKWKEEMDEVQRKSRQMKGIPLKGMHQGETLEQDEDMLTRSQVKKKRERQHAGLRSAGPKQKKSKKHEKLDSIPAAQTVDAGEDELNVDEISTVKQLASNLCARRVAFPDRCSAILQDTMFQYLLCVDPREDQIQRLRHTLPYLVEEEFFSLRETALSESTNSDGTGRTNHSRRVAQLESQRMLLEAMADFCDFLQQTLPELENFVIRYLETWNGVHHVNSILRLTARLQPRSYSDLLRQVLRPLQRVYQNGQVELKAEILTCLRDLLRNWAEIDWEKHLEGQQTVEEQERNEEPSVSTGTIGKPDQHRFVPVPGGVDYFKVMFELVKFVDQLLVAGLIAENDHTTLQLAAGSFFSTVADLHIKHHIPFVLPPSPGLACRLMVSPTAVGVDVICSILVKLRGSLKALRQHVAQRVNLADETANESQRMMVPVPVENGLDKLALYNSYVWDLCNLLWLSKPLPKEPEQVSANETTTVLFRQAEAVGLVNELRRLPSLQVKNAFSLTGAVAFAGFAQTFATEKNLAQAELVGDQRIEYVDFLDKQGCSGLSEFLHTFISRLVKRNKPTS